LEGKVAVPVYKTEIMTVGIRRADKATPLYSQKLAVTSPTSCGHSVVIVRSRTQAMEFVLYLYSFNTFVPANNLRLLILPRKVLVLAG
jgi:hypothetical protein